MLIKPLDLRWKLKIMIMVIKIMRNKLIIKNQLKILTTTKIFLRQNKISNRRINYSEMDLRIIIKTFNKWLKMITLVKIFKIQTNLSTSWLMMTSSSPKNNPINSRRILKETLDNILLMTSKEEEFLLVTLKCISQANIKKKLKKNLLKLFKQFK
jgi:hypothetical protein